jgi:hypothetical protein
MAKSGKNKPAEESDEQDATESHDGGGGADEGSQEEEAPKAKKATGKQKAVSGKAASVSQKGAKGKSTGRMKSVGPRPSGHEMVPVVCSECYEELVYDSGSAATEIVCPVCEHSAGKPDDATLHHISDKRRTEKKNFTLVFMMWFVGAVSLAGWVSLAQSPINAADDAMFYGPFGLGILMFLVTMILTFKYENSRWETYF